MLKATTLSALVVAASAQLGPGAGEWEVVSAESEGLSTSALRAADEATERGMSNRKCFLVAKNGKIVHERYMNGGGQNTIEAAWSVTKSFCASLVGIAAGQGFVNIQDQITSRVSNTLLCNQQCNFEHVLTMTGQSSDLNNPRYSYDTFGTSCLNTLSDLIGNENPAGQTAAEWMQENYRDVLGMSRDMLWEDITNPGNVPCGFGVTATCRDLLRAGQLWANRGQWPGQGQYMDSRYTADGVTPVFPNSGRLYGYTQPVKPQDPVDPLMGEMVGLNAQCVLHSAEHNAVIVSMGSGGSCNTAWTNTRAAIVSNDHELYEETRNIPKPSKAARMAQDIADEIAHRTEILNMAEGMAEHAHLFRPQDLKEYNLELLKYGGEPVVPAKSE